MSKLKLWIDGREIAADEGMSVAAAVMNAGRGVFRRSVTGQVRGPLCGMGICFECRLTIDGVWHAKSCQIECRPGMTIVTG